MSQQTELSLLEDDMIISRYMPFSKYVDFLTNGLFIPTAKMFEDVDEGTVASKYTPIKMQPNGQDDELLQLILKQIKQWCYISCWNKSKVENYAMWKIYGFHGESVRITTTVKKLKRMFRTGQLDNEMVAGAISLVNYVDLSVNESDSLPIVQDMSELYYHKGYENLIDTFLASFIYKHKYYHYEDELRLVIFDKKTPLLNDIESLFKKENNQKFMRLSIPDSISLVDEVFVSPFAEDWFTNLVESTNKKFGLGSIPVTKSGIKTK